RILNLLRGGPLCVCHVQEALQLPQPKISKQLAYLKKHGVLQSRRHNNWTIYEIPCPQHPILAANVSELKSTFESEPYAKDSARLEKIDTSVACIPSSCC
ncbi:ArsR/SmtB family transcription factor, partial [Pelagicoccus mobilis]